MERLWRSPTPRAITLCATIHRKMRIKMNRTLVIPAVLLLAAWAAAQTTPAQMKNPVSTALAVRGESLDARVEES